MVNSTCKKPHNPRQRNPLAEVGLLILGIFFSPLGNCANLPADLPEHCISGYTPLAPVQPLPPPGATIYPQLNSWMANQGWFSAYELWQAARYCAAGYDPLGICTRGLAPSTGACSGVEDGLRFLLMHRYLLQSLRSIWPEPYEALGPWRVFPAAQDYPETLRSSLSPWPAAVRRAAASVDALARMDKAAIVARWPSEGAFGQWLQCGSLDGGQAVDALAPAMVSNLAPASRALEQYVFWRTHAWIDKAWDNYRKALGKTADDPQLQALLLQQCQEQAAWREITKSTTGKALHSAQKDAPLFVLGHLNPAFTHRQARVLGQVVGQVELGGRRFYRVDLHLVGIAPIWVTSLIPLAPPGLALDGRYYFVGTPVNTRRFVSETLNPNKELHDLINTEHLLLVSSISSIK